jgi:4-carboxymuconolactone decarboxylase
MEPNMKPLPKHFQEFTQKHPNIAAAYEKLADECRKAGPLNEKEQALVKLGVAIGSRMEGSVHSQVRKALAAGAKADEIRQAVLLSIVTIGFPNMMAVMSWVNDVLSEIPVVK